MKKQTKQSSQSLLKNASPESPDARKTELDYMCTYMTWLTIKERYNREMGLMAG